jgi:hypothetical protein
MNVNNDGFNNTIENNDGFNNIIVNNDVWLKMFLLFIWSYISPSGIEMKIIGKSSIKSRKSTINKK